MTVAETDAHSDDFDDVSFFFICEPNLKVLSIIFLKKK